MTMTPKHPYAMKLLRAGDIHIDRRYQRKIQTPMIRKIVEEFDYHEVNPVKVIYRSGEYYAFDGQQTTAGCLQKFGDDYLLPCLIYDDVPSWQDEAKLFEKINSKDAKKTVSDSDRWKSRMSRGDEIALDITAIANKYGLRICDSSGNKCKGVIRSIAALDAIYSAYGRDVLSETIEILSRSFMGDLASLQSPMLRATAMFVSKYTGLYNKKAFIDRLSKTTAANILRVGKASVATGNTKYARELLAIYNGKSKTKLPDLF